jgi:hypothetical protein
VPPTLPKCIKQAEALHAIALAWLKKNKSDFLGNLDFGLVHDHRVADDAHGLHDLAR